MIQIYSTILILSADERTRAYFHQIWLGGPTLHQLYREEWSLQPFYAAHLYASQYPYSHKTTSEQLEIFKTVNSTFGRLARFALFGDASPCRKRTG